MPGFSTRPPEGYFDQLSEGCRSCQSNRDARCASGSHRRRSTRCSQEILTRQATQREAATSWGVDRTTVVHICRVAKEGALAALAASVPGRPSGAASPEQAELAAARTEIERLRATVTEQAVALHLHQGKSRWD